MANGTFSFGTYRLSWLHEEACAVQGSGANRNRYRLGVFRTPGDGGAGEKAARAALVSFVQSEATAQAQGDGTIGALWKAYRDDREKDGKQMQPFDSAWKNLEPFFSKVVARDLSKDLCRTYAKDRFDNGKSRRKGQRVSKHTVWTELNKLSSAVSWGVTNGVIIGKAHDWSPIWLPSLPKKSDDVLSPAEVMSMLDGCFFEVETEDQGTQRYALWHLYFFIILMMCTGGRPTAVLQLVGSRCMFGPGLIDLRLKDDDADPMSKKKMKGRAIVHMNNLARTTLIQAKAMIEEHGGNWDTSTIVQWRGASVERINKTFRHLVERVGLPTWVTPHKLRHAVATWVDNEGLEAGSLLGHAKGSKATEIYIHPTGKKTKAAAEFVDKALGGKRMKSV